MEEKEKLIEAMNNHAQGMDIKELEMVLRYMYALEDMR